MKGNDFWERYCSFYEKDFSQQVEFNRGRMEKYFQEWRKTDLAKMLCQTAPETLQEVPISTYRDYPMMREFGHRIADATRRSPRRQEELFKGYYDRISADIGSSLNRYMVEPYFLCMKTTGSTGENKWVAHGETFWRNFFNASTATYVVSCSEGWGETKLRAGDKAINLNARIPYISGWGAWVSQTHLKLVPPIEVADNLGDLKEKFNLILKSVERGEKVALGGGIGAIFYMICKYFTDPQEFYEEYYKSMSLGLKKTLLSLKLLQLRIRKKEAKRILDIMPLKGILIAGVEAKLYIEFFKKEFNLEPLHIYGSTEAGPVMKGDPDRKTDLVPDLRTSYLEFQTPDGEIRSLDELKKGRVYDLVVTPFGSILFRYDMEDFFRVTDFRDDDMPILAFEGRKIAMLKLYAPYIVSPKIIVQALYKAGLRSSDKWAVTKLLKPREHLHFLIEKSWPYSEKEAEKIIFNSLLEADLNMEDSGDTLKDYVRDFKIKDPSLVVKVEYLKPGAFLRYSMIKGKAGSPIGQYKPPKIIPPDKMEICETLRSA